MEEENPKADFAGENDEGELDATLHDIRLLYRVPFGEPLRVKEDLYLVRVPLPGNSLISVNSYFILDGDETTIVDVGFNHPDCERALDDALKALGRSWDGVRIVVTHSHPDHAGNLDRIYFAGMPVLANIPSFQEVSDMTNAYARVFMPVLWRLATPEEQGQLIQATQDGALPLPAELQSVRARPDITFLEEGDELRAGKRTFQVLETPGHDPWHICLYEPDEKFMIVGDHALERITPSISTWLIDRDPLAQFQESLRKLYRCDVDLVLPAHGALYNDLHGRVTQLLAHHEGRLQEIYELVAQGHEDLTSVSSHAKWRYGDWPSWALDQKLMSMGETLAHLVRLANDGKIKLEDRGDGDFHFELA